MGYVLTVAGDCTIPNEHELAEALAQVLSDPKYGVTGSQLYGIDVNGPVHNAPPKRVTPKTQAKSSD